MSTWNPLQIPSTRPPSSAWRRMDHDRAKLRQSTPPASSRRTRILPEGSRSRPFEVRVLVPEHLRLRAENVASDVQGVVMQFDPEDDDAEFHRESLARLAVAC